MNPSVGRPLRRLLTLAGVAAGPVLVLCVFFVLPVCGMLAEGLWPDGRFDPGEGEQPPQRAADRRVHPWLDRRLSGW